jgi:aryl-phospho-beta-D-glucosidase BglC (GH1 family)
MPTLRATLKGCLLIVAVITVLASQTAAVSATQQSFLQTEGRWIVDSHNSPILLRGINYWGYQHVAHAAHTEDDYRMFSQWGLNVVRLVVSWGVLEPRPGYFDSSYLANTVSLDIQWAKKYGLYVILDFHQTNWAERWDGSGAPDWAVQKYPANSTGSHQAVLDFFANYTLQDHMIQTWVNVARAYANEPAVAGYDLLNEPYEYYYVSTASIDAFYTRAIAAIRNVDMNHLIFIETEGGNTSNLPRTGFGLSISNKTNLVWSPHFYELAWDGYSHSQEGYLETVLLSDYTRYTSLGLPVWIGEFGAFMSADNNSLWLQDVQYLFNKYQLGWAWWSYNGRSSNGDPQYVPPYTSFPDALYHPTENVTTITVQRRY